jgi:hypothetical protein
MTEDLGAALDALITRFGYGAFAAEIARARELYANRTGRVFEDDAELYEARAAAFLEWYALERPIDAAGVPPVIVAHREQPSEALRALATSHRSLFVVEDLADGAVLLLDLIGGTLFEITERRRLFGVNVGDVLEARLIAWQEHVVFGRTFCYHPAGARAALVEHARRIRAEGGTREDCVDYAASLRVRAERYKHVAPLRVYETSTSEFREPPRPETIR